MVGMAKFVQHIGLKYIYQRPWEIVLLNKISFFINVLDFKAKSR
jgi:hypothetical protein